MTNADINNRVYDASCMSDHLLCPKLFYYRWVRKLVPRVEPAPLSFGRAFHEALHRWYEKKPLEECLLAFDVLPKVMEDDRRSPERGKAIFKEYVERWGEDDVQYGTLGLEKDFHIDMGDGRFYVGRLDRVVREVATQQVYVKDHKTTRSLGLNFYRSFRPSVQIDGYCFGCRATFGQCSGAIINGISIAANPKERFRRDISPRTPAEIDRFPLRFAEWTKRIEADILMKEFPHNYTSCTHWGQCKYLDLCLYGEDERTIERDFKLDEEGGSSG